MVNDFGFLKPLKCNSKYRIKIVKTCCLVLALNSILSRASKCMPNNFLNAFKSSPEMYSNLG